MERSVDLRADLQFVALDLNCALAMVMVASGALD